MKELLDELLENFKWRVEADFKAEYIFHKPTESRDTYIYMLVLHIGDIRQIVSRLEFPEEGNRAEIEESMAKVAIEKMFGIGFSEFIEELCR